MTQPDIAESKTILRARKVEFKPKPAVSNDGKVGRGDRGLSVFRILSGGAWRIIRKRDRM